MIELSVFIVKGKTISTELKKKKKKKICVRYLELKLL